MRKDITNEVFGNLIVKEYLGAFPIGNQGITRGKWLCSCSCGKETAVDTSDLTSGKTKSCGCFGLIDIEGNRRCPACYEFLTKNHFRLGNSACKSCTDARKYKYISKEEISKRQKETYKKHRKKRLDYAKKYNKNNPEMVRENSKRWRQKNPNYKKDKWRTDPEFRLKNILRNRFYKVIKGYSKSGSVLSLIGCSVSELKDYLQSMFVGDMSWDNYGEWHIDHIKPCSLFDFSIESEQQECFHYTNLQPIWAVDNLIKSNKY